MDKSKRIIVSKRQFDLKITIIGSKKKKKKLFFCEKDGKIRLD